MSTRGFFGKIESEGFPYYLNFSNNIGVPNFVQSVVVSAVDHLGNPAPEVLGSVTILPPYRVSVEVVDGVDEAVYTITGTATTDDGYPYTVIIDMLIDNDGSYDDQLSDIEAKIDAIRAKTDNLPVDPATTSQLDIIQAEHVTIIADLDNPDLYKADISGLTADIGAVQVVTDAIKVQTDTIDWTDIEFIKAIEGGRWKVFESQMLFYAEDNTTLVASFDLFKADGTPAITPEDMFERRRV